MLHLFVYGTLCRGEANDLQRVARQRGLPSPRLIGEGSVRGRLYDLGDWPGLVVDPAGGVVAGEVWQIDAKLVPVLDAIEEVGDGAAAPGQFLVASVDVRIGDATVRCRVYPIVPLANGPLIASGDWRGWRQQRGC